MKLFLLFLSTLTLFAIPFFWAVGIHPLWYFVSSSSYRMAALTIHLGADPNFCENRSRECPLILAAIRQDFKMIQLLVENGADVHQRNRNGANVLNVQCSNMEIVRYFLDRGVYLNNQSSIQDKSGFTPLHCAVTAGSLDVVKLLVERGADKSKTISSWAGRTHVTPLQLAEMKNQRDLIPFLK